MLALNFSKAILLSWNDKLKKLQHLSTALALHESVSYSIFQFSIFDSTDMNMPKAH